MNMKKINDEFMVSSPNCSAFVTINSDEYFEAEMAILKNIVNRDMSVVYVTTNRTYAFLSKKIRKNKINTKNIFFIDCITRLISDVPKKIKAKNVIYAPNPHNLRDLSKMIVEVTEALPTEKRYLLLDGVSDLLIYNSPDVVKLFLRAITKKIKKLDINAIFLSTEKRIDMDMERQIGPYFDKMIDLTGSIERKLARFAEKN